MVVFFLLTCDMSRVLITQIGFVTMVEDDPATIEDQKLTMLTLSDQNVSHSLSLLGFISQILPEYPAKNSLDLP